MGSEGTVRLVTARLEVTAPLVSVRGEVAAPLVLVRCDAPQLERTSVVSTNNTKAPVLIRERLSTARMIVAPVLGHAPRYGRPPHEKTWCDTDVHGPIWQLPARTLPLASGFAWQMKPFGPPAIG